MSVRKALKIRAVEYLEDERGNQLPHLHEPPPGFQRKVLFTFWLSYEGGGVLPVLRRPARSIGEAVEVAEALCRRHGWQRT